MSPMEPAHLIPRSHAFHPGLSTLPCPREEQLFYWVMDTDAVRTWPVDSFEGQDQDLQLAMEANWEPVEGLKPQQRCAHNICLLLCFETYWRKALCRSWALLIIIIEVGHHILCKPKHLHSIHIQPEAMIYSNPVWKWEMFDLWLDPHQGGMCKVS